MIVGDVGGGWLGAWQMLRMVWQMFRLVWQMLFGFWQIVCWDGRCFRFSADTSPRLDDTLQLLADAST